jgi:hypothetical protein
VELRRFDLLFVRGRSLIGRLVQAVTRSPYSHVAIVLDQWHVAETDWRYPLTVRHLSYPTDTFDVYRYRGELTAEQLTAMECFLHEKLTTPYDYLQSITNGLYLLVGIPIRDAPGRMNCSETVDRMFAAAGIDLCPAVLGHVTPADLARSEKLQKIT